MSGSGSGQHSAKGTKRHNMMRSAKNKRTGKYVRQRARTEQNKARRVLKAWERGSSSPGWNVHGGTAVRA